MKGEVLTRFRNSASYAQILLFDQMQKEYGRLCDRDKWEEAKKYILKIELFVIFCAGTIVSNERR